VNPTFEAALSIWKWHCSQNNYQYSDYEPDEYYCWTSGSVVHLENRSGVLATVTTTGQVQELF